MVRGEDSAERQLQTLEVVAKQRTVETNGTEADTRSYSEQFYELSNGPKELFWVEGATHVALYDIPEYVNQAVPKLTAFFGKIL